MEEKRYPILEEEQGGDIACEPIAEAATPVYIPADGVTEVHDSIDELDWDRFPSYGPFSEEEAIARIDKFEEELAQGKVKWISSEEAWAQLYERHPWLR